MDAILIEEDESPKASSYSLGKRTTAAGFIGVVLFGNLWLSYHLFSAAPPSLIEYGFYGCSAVAALGGLLSLYSWVLALLSGQEDD